MRTVWRKRTAGDAESEESARDRVLPIFEQHSGARFYNMAQAQAYALALISSAILVGTRS